MDFVPMRGRAALMILRPRLSWDADLAGSRRSWVFSRRTSWVNLSVDGFIIVLRFIIVLSFEKSVPVIDK